MSVLYLVMSFGVAPYQHICKKKSINISGVSYVGYQNSDFPCSLCKNKGKEHSDQKKEPCKKDCCKKEIKFLKVDDFITHQPNFDSSIRFWGEAIPNKMLGSVFDLLGLNEETDNNSPPFSSKIRSLGNPYYIFYCVYRI